MSPDELRSSLRESPFRPFRLFTTNGASYDVVHPDFLMVGARTAVVGLVSAPEQQFFDYSVKVDLLHVTRIEPLAPRSESNGAS